MEGISRFKTQKAQDPKPAVWAECTNMEDRADLTWLISLLVASSSYYLQHMLFQVVSYVNNQSSIKCTPTFVIMVE